MKFIRCYIFSSRVFPSLLCISFCLLCFSTVYAQSDTTHALKEVRVLGVSVPVVKTIIPSQQITERDFKRFSAYNVADAIRNFSGVNIKDYGGIGGLKTVSVRSLGANHTGVQYDGVQIADAQNGQVDLGKINLDNVESITLYNGQPGEITVPARSFASASLLVIKSLNPVLSALKPYKVTLGLKTGSFGLFNPTVQWQQRINEKWSLNFTSSVQNANGKYKYKVEGDGSDTLAIRTNANVRTAQSDLSLFRVAKDSSRINFRTNFSNSDRGLPGAVVFYNPYSNQQLRTRDYFVQSGYDKKWRTFHLLVNAKFSNNYTRYVDPDYLNSAGILDLRYTQNEVYGSAVISHKLTENFEVAYASDMALTLLKTNLYQYAYPERSTYLNAVSSKLNLGRLKLQGTLLNTLIHENVQSGAAPPNRIAWSPSVLASYQPSDSSAFMYRAFYKNIFRNPTFNDLYYTQTGNRTLKPEYASQYNLGLTFSKAGTYFNYITLTNDIYYNHVKDKIIAIPNKNLFTWSMLNLGEVDIWGSDFSIKTQIPLAQDLNVSFSGNYTFQKAIDVSDKKSSVYLNQIPYTPEHTFSINAGLSGPNWNLFYNQVYSSSRYYLSENLPEYDVPGFMISDLSINYRFDKKHFPVSLSADINNLFNTPYSFIRNFPMPGRSIRLSIQINI